MLGKDIGQCVSSHDTVLKAAAWKFWITRSMIALRAFYEPDGYQAPSNNEVQWDVNAQINQLYEYLRVHRCQSFVGVGREVLKFLCTEPTAHTPWPTWGIEDSHQFAFFGDSWFASKGRSDGAKSMGPHQTCVNAGDTCAFLRNKWHDCTSPGAKLGEIVG